MAKHVYCHHRTEIEVPFFDVDAMHIVWHGHYVKYLEVARCAFLAEIGYDYNEMGRQGFSWPVVQLNLKYVQPARFGAGGNRKLPAHRLHHFRCPKRRQAHQSEHHPSGRGAGERRDAVSNAGKLAGGGGQT